MGAIESKMNVTEDSETNKNNTTPQEIKTKTVLDPRSPSVDIARTPVEVLKTPIQLSSATITSTTDMSGTPTLFDPRSPTTEFTRTPIVLNIVKEPPTLHNKLLDNARTPQLVPTPAKVKRPSRLLKTHEIEPKTAIHLHENKRSSLVGLLETNIDFVETDLDAVMLNKSAKDEVKSFVEPDVQQDEDVPIPIEDVTPTEADLSSIDALNRKLTNLIYEDKMTVNKTPIKSGSVIKERIPLHEQNLNSQSKLIPVLKVSDKPTKLPKSGSKIPVFKDRKLKGKNVQCENTPPIANKKPAQWAAEDSMII